MESTTHQAPRHRKALRRLVKRRRAEPIAGDWLSRCLMTMEPVRKLMRRRPRSFGNFCLACATLLTSPALSDEAGPGQRAPDAAGVLEEVVTVATKKGGAEAAKDVPAAISVIDGESMALRQTTDIEDLSYALPNVALDGIGTGKGIANFSIRGLGVSGSIPSIDPTVGVFVDGVYLGVNYGVIVDMMDLEAMEVLRGPQGLLFGRNVTGGAVLLRSRRPSGGRSASASARLETGIDSRVAASAEGSLAGGTVNARLSAQFRNDDGWFANDAPGAGRMGADRTWQVRGVATLAPSETFDLTLIHERGDTDSDGPATQNRRRFSGFDLAIDEPGYSRIDWSAVTVEANRRVQFGNGRVTNIFGWRTVEHHSLADVDGTTSPIFHLFGYTDQSQVSNELR
ncbi:MAG: TonB-dependent receptor plug domain-containing protein, partial [Gammaproteobacteria bacterium]|nr:TonB-dependent receptor plug domain-containing protein [Gammaproteobacteria bacterium]